MIVVRETLGTVEELAGKREHHEERGTLERITVDERERNRSRFKTELEDGTELGIVLGDHELSPGDVLVADDERMVVVEFERREVLVVSVPEMNWKEALELGHHMGNQHWELAVRGDELLVPIVGERRLMERTLREELSEGATIGTEAVDPALFDDATADHDHAHGHPHGEH
ncbi:urease accessory protein UreE [Halalkalicoccus jeotgali]|uniref:Urease accessory protein UreE n=1 Tax=Halalkalicoccus jeotgali (strain DSM 18796 / CECT 7217 / JCM 14584 / KCTC 4019 / B3) TaxID=795797 RepID=D8J7E1_HALJB|nr:urease accessory protein UreE [Halalkalicoccus jeotgali]ADJ14036.1 urease accessory protein UreE [Halalkalicoccus jeotgali B3]ELY33920.1 urease accessory protein UreE [Halalkalicoccus jeotgali B3]